MLQEYGDGSLGPAASGESVDGVERPPPAREEAASGPSGGDALSVPAGLMARVAELERVADQISRSDPADLSGEAAAELALRVHRALDRLHATRLGWLAVAEDHGAWLGSGARSFKAWIARTHEVPFVEAQRWTRAARVWHDRARATGEAARLGLVASSKAMLIAAAASSPLRVEALAAPVQEEPAREGALQDEPAREGAAQETQEAQGVPGADPSASSAGGRGAPTGEEVLLGLAQGCTVEQFGKITRRFAHVVDPEADERGFRDALEREHFDLASTTGGYHLSGFLTDEHGQLVKTALRAVTGVPAAGDTRSVTQRRAAALASLARLVLDKGLVGTVGTVRPHLSVHVTLTELERLWARLEPRTLGALDLAALVSSPPAEWEDGRGPIPEHVLRRLAADSEVTRVVLGPDSQVIDVGRTARTFTGHLRRAVVARDRECVVDGCGAPPSIGQVHHAVTRWADGGVTSIDNAALVCAFHNQWLEDHRVPMRWVVGVDGRGSWEVGRPGTYRPARSARVPRTGPDDKPP